MCSGRIGTRRSGQPVAARIAAATAGPDEIVGGSPTPRSAVRRVRVGVLEHLDLHRRHVEDRRDQVVGERRVPHRARRSRRSPPSAPAPCPARVPPWIWPTTASRVDRLADVLGAVSSATTLTRPELDVDVDDRAVRGERELHVRVALPGLRVDRRGSGGAATRRSPRRRRRRARRPGRRAPRRPAPTTLPPSSRRSGRRRGRAQPRRRSQHARRAPPRRPPCTAPPVT